MRAFGYVVAFLVFSAIMALIGAVSDYYATPHACLYDAAHDTDNCVRFGATPADTVCNVDPTVHLAIQQNRIKLIETALRFAKVYKNNP